MNDLKSDPGYSSSQQLPYAYWSSAVGGYINATDVGLLYSCPEMNGQKTQQSISMAMECIPTLEPISNEHNARNEGGLVQLPPLYLPNHEVRILAVIKLTIFEGDGFQTLILHPHDNIPSTIQRRSPDIFSDC